VTITRANVVGQSFEGGIADAPFHEPQAGYTFCSLGSLAFLSRLELGQINHARPRYGPSSPPNVVRWLLSLQTDFIDPDTPPAADLSIQSSILTEASNDENREAIRVSSTSESHQQQNEQQNQTPSSALHQSPDKSTMWAPGTFDPSLIVSASSSSNLPSDSSHPFPQAGMCGRLCKPADTCYAFWAGASLHLLEQSHLASKSALRHYLLALTQHPIMGGFSKFPGDKWADLYHSYLGLAALSLISTAAERETDGIKELDAGMCVSADVRSRLEGIWEGFEG
jgi:geranylgeranyl transferase type-1 subunit beta